MWLCVLGFIQVHNFHGHVWGKNVDDRSFMHVDDKKVILVIGDSLTQGLDDTTITSKA